MTGLPAAFGPRGRNAGMQRRRRQMESKRRTAAKTWGRRGAAVRSFLKRHLEGLPREDSRRPREAEIEGYCLRCGEVTRNTGIWVGKFLKARRCESCGEVMRAGRRTMAECYLDEFADRLAKFPPMIKPKNLRSLRGHVHELPARALKKAAREIAYVSDLFLAQTNWDEDGC